MLYHSSDRYLAVPVPMPQTKLPACVSISAPRPSTLGVAPPGPCLSDQTSDRTRSHPGRAGECLHARQGGRADLPPSLAKRCAVHEAAARLHLDPASPRSARARLISIMRSGNRLLSSAPHSHVRSSQRNSRLIHHWPLLPRTCSRRSRYPASASHRRMRDCRKGREAMIKIVHPIAGTLAILTIASFWLSTALTELFASHEIVTTVKTAIAWGSLLLIPALAAAGGSGFALTKGRRAGLTGAKIKRMPFIAANGILLLVPSERCSSLPRREPPSLMAASIQCRHLNSARERRTSRCSASTYAMASQLKAISAANQRRRG
jgi:hypothetical protein